MITTENRDTKSTRDDKQFKRLTEQNQQNGGTCGLGGNEEEHRRNQYRNDETQAKKNGRTGHAARTKHYLE